MGRADVVIDDCRACWELQIGVKIDCALCTVDLDVMIGLQRVQRQVLKVRRRCFPWVEVLEGRTRVNFPPQLLGAEVGHDVLPGGVNLKKAGSVDFNIAGHGQKGGGTECVAASTGEAANELQGGG